MRWSYLHVAGHISRQSIVIEAFGSGDVCCYTTSADVKVPAALVATESVRDKATWIVPLSTRSFDSSSRRQLEIACGNELPREMCFERPSSNSEGIMLSERQIQTV